MSNTIMLKNKTEEVLRTKGNVTNESGQIINNFTSVVSVSLGSIMWLNFKSDLDIRNWP